MRTIKFRGKRVDNGEWVYGYVYKIERKDLWFIDNGKTVSHQVIPETLGQFTGLKDKNGNKIFEGDLIQWTSTDTDGSLMTKVDEVKWSKYGWVCGKELQCLADYLLFDPSYENLELIGNIHDNKEML